MGRCFLNSLIIVLELPKLVGIVSRHGSFKCYVLGLWAQGSSQRTNMTLQNNKEEGQHLLCVNVNMVMWTLYCEHGMAL